MDWVLDPAGDPTRAARASVDATIPPSGDHRERATRTSSVRRGPLRAATSLA